MGMIVALDIVFGDEVHIEENAKWLCMAEYDKQVRLFAEVEPDAQKEPYRFHQFDTGAVVDNSALKFTCMIQDDKTGQCTHIYCEKL